jgi:hypothetical protein
MQAIKLAESSVRTCILAMEFHGAAKPIEGCAGVMQASMTGRYFGAPDGARTTESVNDSLSFSSIVTMLPNGRFVEAGEIGMGSAGTLRFDSPVEGVMTPAAAHSVTAGGVVWRILGGSGEFADATGFVTSNFTVAHDGQVVDRQVATVLLP